jgi:nucleoside-diphosphate-sugar epimerase
MQTILGANGTIGRLLAKELSKYTGKVRLVSRNPRRINQSDELYPLDLLKPGAVNKAVEGSDVVYLTVGLEYKLKVWEQQWPLIMRETIDACIKHNAKLVFFDNVYMYDKNAVPHMTEESAVSPASRKGQVRKRISEMLLTAERQGKVTALIARSADFYGPDNKNSFVNEMVLKNLAAGKRAMWFMNRSVVHSFTYTPDAAAATALLGNTPDAYGQVWHLPTESSRLTGTDFIKMCAEELKVKPRITVVSPLMIRLLGLFIPVMREMPEKMYQYDRDYFFDSSKFTSRFGITATPYLTGIQESCKSFLPKR